MIVEINTGIRHSRRDIPIYITVTPEPTRLEAEKVFTLLMDTIEAQSMKIPYTTLGASMIQVLMNQEWEKIRTREQTIRVEIE